MDSSERGVIENVVPSRAGAGTKVLYVFLWIVTALFLMMGLVRGFIPLLIGVVLVFVTWWMSRMTQIEYEYSYFDKELHVARIMKKEARKELGTYNLDEMQIGGPVRSYHLDNFRNKDKDLKTLDYSSKVEKQPDPRYALYFADKRILIEPDAELAQALHEKFPRKFYLD